MKIASSFLKKKKKECVSIKLISNKKYKNLEHNFLYKSLKKLSNLTKYIIKKLFKIRG